jgi:hypothetical protein
MLTMRGNMVKRKTVRKKPQKARKKAKKAPINPVEFNHRAQWKAYRELQMKADKAWEKFRNDVKKNAKSDILIRDHNHLLLLLGECNYMARECMRIASKRKKRR